jgi:hypothetical protein
MHMGYVVQYGIHLFDKYAGNIYIYIYIFMCSRLKITWEDKNLFTVKYYSTLEGQLFTYKYSSINIVYGI